MVETANIGQKLKAKFNNAESKRSNFKTTYQEAFAKQRHF
jgi:hypothetical protein